jgi:integrase
MSRADAEIERKKILDPLNARAEASQTSAVTLRRYTEDEYLGVKTRVWKDSTRTTTEQLIDRYILQDLGERTLSSITRKELQAHLDRHAEALNLSDSIVGHIRWQLTAIFEMAEADQLVVKSPANGLVMPHCKEPPPKRTITPDDVLRSQMVLPIRERLIFRLAVCEGMRPGEITALQVGDFHQDGAFHISRRVYSGRIDTPKGRRSRRLIPATATTRALLTQWLELLQNQSSSAWLFPSETGSTPVAYTNVLRRSIRPALSKIGLGHATFQVLRRTWVTEFSAAEKDPAIRAQLAGHTVDVHENEYRQPDPAALRKAMKKLEKRLQ